MKKIDFAEAPRRGGSSYPAPFDAPCQSRSSRSLSGAAGLTALGVNLARIPPGGWSSQRHWHSHEDEFVWIVEGEVVLVTDGGEEILRAGDCAAFKAGYPDGHHLINRLDREALVLQVSNREDDRDACVYPDVDMIAGAGDSFYRRRDGTPYRRD